MAAYCSATKTRELHVLLRDSTEFSDAIITDYCSDHVNWIIDAELAGLITVPLTVVPDGIRAISDLLTASGLIAANRSLRDDYSKWSAAMREQAMEMLARIRSGELALAEIAGGRIVVSDLTEDFPEHTVFVGDETQWESRTENRA